MGIALAVLLVGGFAWLMITGLRGKRQLAARRDPTDPPLRGSDTTRQWAPQSRQIVSAFDIGHWAPIKISWRQARVTLTTLAVVAALADFDSAYTMRQVGDAWIPCSPVQQRILRSILDILSAEGTFLHEYLVASLRVLALVLAIIVQSSVFTPRPT
jgi:hypothetical protein